MKYILLLFFVCCFSAKSQQVIVFQDNLDNDASGWTFPKTGPHDWKWYGNVGVDNSGGIRMKLPRDDDFFASPAVSLEAEKTYSIVFKSKIPKGSTPRTLSGAYNTVPDKTGSTLFFEKGIPTSPYNQLPFTDFSPTFTPTVTGNYHFVFWVEEGSYLFTYFDDFLIEETQLPTLSITSPIDNATYNEGNDPIVTVTAADADGTIEKVRFYLNGEFLFEDDSQPYTYAFNQLLPGDYQVVAHTIDNRGNVSTNETVNFRMNFSDGTFGTYINWNFDDGTYDYWTKKNGNWRPRAGYQGTNSLELFSAYQGNFAASTAFELIGGETYELTFRSDASGSNNPVKAAINTIPTLGGTAIRTFSINGADDFNILQTATFVAPQTATYYLILNYDGIKNYTQLKFDNIRIRGNLNRGALTKLTSPNKSLTISENSTLNLSAEAIDSDGNVVSVKYFADNTEVGESNAEPFDFSWTNVPAGNFEITALATDNAGVSSRSLAYDIASLPNEFHASSFLGGNSDTDAVRGAIIQKNGVIILAANVGNKSFPDSLTTLLNSSTNTTSGIILRLTPDGQKVISVTRLAADLSDMSADSSGNLYVGAAASGYFKLTPKADAILWQKTFPKVVHRLDASKTGNNVVMIADVSNLDENTINNDVEIITYDKDGNLLSQLGGASQYTSDVTIDDASETVVITGFKNFKTYSFVGDTRFLPVYVPVVVGRAFDGTQKYRAYDWVSDSTSVRWLNKSNNNMADLRSVRCSMGADGKLYVLHEVSGGNHVIRYDPFDITQPANIVGGDNYFNFSNTGTEVKLIITRHDPGTGNYLLGQQLTNRLSSPPYRGNTIFGRNGDIQADAEGRIFITGKAASGLPLTVDHQPGTYTGGAYIVTLSPNFRTRERVIRLTNGDGHAIAVRNKDHFVAGGKTKNPLHVTSAFQATSASVTDGWFSVVAKDNPCPANLIITNGTSPAKSLYTAYQTIQSSRLEITAKTTYQAVKLIELQPGFSVGNGNVFETNLLGCDF